MSDLTREEIEEIVAAGAGWVTEEQLKALCHLALRGLEAENQEADLRECLETIERLDDRVKELEEEVQAHKVAIRSAIDIGEQDCEQAEARVKELERALDELVAAAELHEAPSEAALATARKALWREAGGR